MCVCVISVHTQPPAGRWWTLSSSGSRASRSTNTSHWMCLHIRSVSVKLIYINDLQLNEVERVSSACTDQSGGVILMHMNQFHPPLWWKTADIDQGFYVASVQCLVLVALHRPGVYS